MGEIIHLTTIQAAERIGVTPRRVRALIASGRLKAEKVGRDYVIDEDEVKSFRRGKPGRRQKHEDSTK